MGGELEKAQLYNKKLHDENGIPNLQTTSKKNKRKSIETEKNNKDDFKQKSSKVGMKTENANHLNRGNPKKKKIKKKKFWN